MENIEKIFGKVVRQRREKLRLSQENFADKARIHRTYISSIELGKVRVSIVIAFQLAETLGVPLSKLWREVEAQFK